MNKNIKKGYVLKNKMNKTIIVIVDRFIKHKIYKKIIKKKTKLYVHDENNICNIGDIVSVKECRPISKKKSWKLISIIKFSKDDTRTNNIKCSR